MAIENLTSFYPSYSLLDEVISAGNFKHLNLFIDVKNILQLVYVDDIIKSLVESSLESRQFDSSIFYGILNFLIFHKKYADKRNITIDFFLFFEIGESSYHKNIYPKYKYSRRIDDSNGLDREHKEYSTIILQNNYNLLEKFLNKIPNIYVTKLENFEADVVPYYLIRNNYVEDRDAANIIYSSDHDLFQCLELPGNNYIFRKTKFSKKILRKGSAVQNHLKNGRCFPDNYLPMFMAIIGDKSDDIEGIDGLGPKRVEEIIEEVISLGGSVEKIRFNILNGNPIFGATSKIIQNKNIEKVLQAEDTIIRNIKIIDFEVISSILDDPPNTEILNKRKSIENVFENKKVYPQDILLLALKKTGADIPNEVGVLFL